MTLSGFQDLGVSLMGSVYGRDYTILDYLMGLLLGSKIQIYHGVKLILNVLENYPVRVGAHFQLILKITYIELKLIHVSIVFLVFPLT